MFKILIWLQEGEWVNIIQNFSRTLSELKTIGCMHINECSLENTVPFFASFYSKSLPPILDLTVNVMFSFDLWLPCFFKYVNPLLYLLTSAWESYRLNYVIKIKKRIYMFLLFFPSKYDFLFSIFIFFYNLFFSPLYSKGIKLSLHIYIFFFFPHPMFCCNMSI